MKTKFISLTLGFVLASFGASPRALAHCDTLAGPVIVTARQALARGDITPVLKWVKPDDEAGIRAAFAQTLAVRRQSPAAAELADTYFFETLVRVHRAGEGAAYTGLKAEAVEPGIAAADGALATGQRAELIAGVLHPLEAAIRTKFERVLELRAHADESVAAGRAYVAAYVDYVHFLERLSQIAGEVAHSPAGHAH